MQDETTFKLGAMTPWLSNFLLKIFIKLNKYVFLDSKI
jgi:hypothetical protein